MGSGVRVTLNDLIDRVSKLNNGIKLYGVFVDMKTPTEWQCERGHIWMARPDGIVHGRGCPYCASRRILKGFNDLWTVDPKVAELLTNKGDGYKCGKGSSVKLSFTCPYCGKQSEKIVADVCRQGFHCQHCSDGVSYPNKFGRAFLSQLPIEGHKCEYSPDWAKPYFYDNYFVYNGKQYILEMDGAFHFLERKGMASSLEQRKEVDRIKIQLALEHGINIIHIDCLISDAEYIKSNILQSTLNKVFDLSSVDWQKCDEQGQSNLVKNACDMYKSGIKSLKDIGMVLNLHEDTIRSYLKRGAKLEWCDYDPTLTREQMYENKSKHIIVLDDNERIIHEFRSTRICEKQMNELYNLDAKRSSIQWACKTHKPYKGFNFRFANETIQN